MVQPSPNNYLQKLDSISLNEVRSSSVSISPTANVPVILIVDDDRVVRFKLRHILVKDGYVVKEAIDGQQGLLAFEKQMPDLVFLDAMMPEIDGFELCAQIRALPNGAFVPILMITGLADEPSVNKAFEAGATDYILKPINISVVRRRVDYLIRAQLAEEKRRQSEERYRSLFEDSSISIWLDDWSAVKTYLDQLLANGINNFRAYFEDNPAAVITCLSLVNVIDVNQTSLTLFEADSKEQLLGSLSDIVVPESHASFCEQLCQLAEGKVRIKIEGVNQTLAGNRINVVVSLSVMPGYEQSLARVIVSIMDITEQRQVEQALLEAQKLAGLGTLVAGVAHELNTPLQVITGTSQRILKSLAKDEVDLGKIQSRLERLQRSSWRCAEIIKALRVYDQLSASRSSEQIALNTLVQDSLLLVEDKLKQQPEIRLETTLTSDVPNLLGDRLQLTQGVANLLSNACDAMAGGGLLTIGTAYNPIAQQVQLWVKDTGEGMSDVAQKKIFDPFFTTKPMGQGVGLGLSVVIGTIRAHGGDIAVESTLGQGSTFTIILPKDALLIDKPKIATSVGRFDK